MRDYYSILGVGENASAQQIKAAFRKLCMQYHPDKTGGNKTLEEKFRQILAAYEVLGDPQQKYLYDQRLARQRAAAAAAAHRPQQVYHSTPPAGKTYSFQMKVQVSARFPRTAMLLTAGVLCLFFISLYLFGPKPRNPAAEADGPVSLPPSITSGLTPVVKDPNPPLILSDGTTQRLRAFLAEGDSTHAFVNMDADDVPELVAGSYLFAADTAGRYRQVFHYNGAMYVQGRRLFLYFNDLVGEYRSCYRCGVKQLANDESIAEIRMQYDSGRVVFTAHDEYRTLAILENLRYLFKRGIPPTDEYGRDDGTRKELLRHFIAYHFNHRKVLLTEQLFRELYREEDREVLWRDLQDMIGILEKRITSATAPGQ